MDKEHNHNVYVSGLPDDITIEEFAELMSKYGIIMENEEGVVRACGVGRGRCGCGCEWDLMV